jgi:bifunctional DNA-binding transcriptional regulator/antitoxin component of YhaV-PrlF toxin-antitoxin module
MKIYKILGKRGRITIPYAIRQKLGFEKDDVISFEAQDDGSVSIRAEPRCCGCREDDQPSIVSLQDILDELPMDAKRDALVYLSVQLALNHRESGAEQ